MVERLCVCNVGFSEVGLESAREGVRICSVSQEVEELETNKGFLSVVDVLHPVVVGCVSAVIVTRQVTNISEN
jgi:hypothetical protein